MAQISGRSVRGLLRFAKEYGYPGGVPALVAALPKESQEVLRETIRTGEWLPYRVYPDLLRALTAFDARAMQAIGHQSLRWDAASILKILSVFSSVDALVTRGFGAWGRFLWSRHCDGGDVFLLDHAPGTATMGLRNFPDIDPIHCQLTVEYLSEMALAVGAKNVRVEQTRCVHRGDEVCEFRGSWKRNAE